MYDFEQDFLEFLGISDIFELWRKTFFLCWIIKVWDYQRSDKIGIDGQLHRLTFEQFPTHDESV